MWMGGESEEPIPQEAFVMWIKTLLDRIVSSSYFQTPQRLTMQPPDSI
jgi:hypothetical protein